MKPFDQLVAPDYPVFLGSEFEHPAAGEALFHVLPVPLEASVSYGTGASLGPSSILKASWQLETWDGKSNPSSEKIHTLRPIDCSRGAAEALKAVSRQTTQIARSGKLPVVLGGEHTVTLGVLQGLLDAGVKDIGVVQIDAHADLREAYEDNPLSHASVMKRIVDLNIPIYQLGVRALCEEEITTRKRLAIPHIDAEKLVKENIRDVPLPRDFPTNVFFTLDIDGLDPSVFPSTGTPVPGGLGWYQTLALFESVASQRNIIGFDIMEFAPIAGFPAYDFSAALLCYKLMGLVQRNL